MTFAIPGIVSAVGGKLIHMKKRSSESEKPGDCEGKASNHLPELRSPLLYYYEETLFVNIQSPPAGEMSA